MNRFFTKMYQLIKKCTICRKCVKYTGKGTTEYEGDKAGAKNYM